MDLEQLPAMRGGEASAFENAYDIQLAREHAKVAHGMAVESISPYADFAQSLFESRNARQEDQTTPLIRVGDNEEGQPVYVYTQKDGGAPDTRHFSFVTCIAAEISTDEFDELGDEDREEIEFLGVSLEGKTLYGVIVVREPLSDVTDGYENLRTIEAVEKRKDKSIAQLGDIKQTVAYIKNGILTAALNPSGAAMLDRLGEQIVAEEKRLRQQ